jgi:DNA processing protein
MFAKLFDTKPQIAYSQETIDTLRLIRSQNIGNKTFLDLIKVFGKPSEAIKHVQEMSLKGGKKKPITLCSLADAKAEIQKTQELGARIIAYHDALYPKLLRHISDPPAIINTIGRHELLNSRTVAIVGARNCSISGLQFTEKLAHELSQAGLTIASGFARGIDTSAHKASIENSTIAVLAGGIDHIYPYENKELYYKIAEKGCVVAELPPGSAPSSQHFPQRNRIISGISLATIIIEASLGSGSLITANLALDQGREVFAVPGFPSDPRYKGNNKLLKQGALIVESAEDVLNNLPNLEFKNSKSKKQFNNLEESFGPRYKTASKDLAIISNPMRQEVLALLSNVPVDIELLSKHSQVPINIIYIIIIELELAEKITRHPGNKISLNYPSD